MRSPHDGANVITETYRLQLSAGCGLREAARILDYLDALGISHVHAGSGHGSERPDTATSRPEPGDEPELIACNDALAASGLRCVVHVVPSHLGAGAQGAWWWDVLENGPSSVYADHFDIAWHPPEAALKDKVLLPLLGAPYTDVLESGELTLERHGGAFSIRYLDRRLPLSPPTVAPLLFCAAAGAHLPPEDARRQELQSIATALENLPASTERAPAQRAARARDKEVLKRRLAIACEDPVVGAAVDQQVRRLNGTPGEAPSFAALAGLLRAQCYRLALWRVPTEELNYRRSFDVDELPAVRMDRQAVFDDVHRGLFACIRQGRLDGICLHRTDGLRDPADYVQRLRRAVASMIPPRALHFVDAKLPAPEAEWPQTWALDGTTGHDLLARVSGLFLDLTGAILQGSYVPLRGGDELVAFAREHVDGTVVAAVTRLPSRVTRGEAPWALGQAWDPRTVALSASLRTSRAIAALRVPGGRALDRLAGPLDDDPDDDLAVAIHLVQHARANPLLLQEPAHGGLELHDE